MLKTQKWSSRLFKEGAKVWPTDKLLKKEMNLDGIKPKRRRK